MEPSNQDSLTSQSTESDIELPALTLLEQGCIELGCPLTAQQIRQFAQFYLELITWNQKFNLTAITELADVQTKHFLDSLAGLPLLVEELGETMPPTRPLHGVDIGTGAGLPGVPLKIVAPRLKWTLIDGTGKKIVFLKQLLTKLALTNVAVVQGRAEELGRQTDYRGQFDIVTARAVAPLDTLAEYLLPLARVNGLVMIYKGGSAPQEFINARKAIDTLGGETVRMAPVQVPFLEEQRYILLVRKVRPTPPTYPRGQGLARKKPLGA
ncbi:MAG: 16S rRNA (guanine(527)-N(7))-methyltransferase RsmG [Caldilineaceae bacterium]